MWSLRLVVRSILRLRTVLQCVVEDNPVSKAVNKVFTLSKLDPPVGDVVDADGVMLFPGLSNFSIAPPGIAKLTEKEVANYLEVF